MSILNPHESSRIALDQSGPEEVSYDMLKYGLLGLFALGFGVSAFLDMLESSDIANFDQETQKYLSAIGAGMGAIAGVTLAFGRLVGDRQKWG